MAQKNDPFETMLADTLSRLGRGPAASPSKTVEPRPTAELVRLRAEIMRRHGMVLDIVGGFLVVLDSDVTKNYSITNITSKFVNDEHKIYTELLVSIHGINEKFQLGLASERVDAVCDALLDMLLSPDKSSTKAEPQRESVAETLPLPTEIPEEEKYAAWFRRNGRDSLVRFLQEGWPAPYIEAKVLSRPDLLHLDKSSYDALNSFLKKGGSLPADLELPARAYRRAGDLTHVDRESLREAESLARAKRRADKQR